MWSKARLHARDKMVNKWWSSNLECVGHAKKNFDVLAAPILNGHPMTSLELATKFTWSKSGLTLDRLDRFENWEPNKWQNNAQQ